MKLDRAIRLEREAQSKLSSLFWRARHYQLTHDRMLEVRNTIYNELTDCPRWVIARLEGYWEAQTERLYEQDLEYCSRQADGALYSHYSGSPRYYGKHGVSPRECHENGTETGHYWSGTDKPFFTNPTA